MSLWKWTPYVKLTANTAFANTPATPTVVVSSASGSLTGTNIVYRYVACYDGVGRLKSVPSAVSTGVSPSSKYATVTWTAYPKATWYLLYRSINGGSYYLVYSGPDTSFVDNSTTARGTVAWTPNLSPVNSATIDLRPVTFAANGNLSRVTSLVYEDLSDPSAFQSVNRNQLAKEFGVRVRVGMTFHVQGGSTDEETLTSIYGAKLAFPNATISLALDGSAGNPTWRDVRIIGNFSRLPTSGKNTMNEISWEFITVGTISSVPALVNTDGTGCW